MDGSLNSEFEGKNPEDGIPSGLLSEVVEERGGATCRAFKSRVRGKWLFIKMLRPEYEADSRMREAFRKEAAVGYRLSHTSLPHYEYVDDLLPEGSYVAMEYIDGLTLDRFISLRPRYFSERANLDRFVRELYDVVCYLHSHQIIHLDIKPSNLMITNVGRSLKLIDLGFCHSDVMDTTRGLTAEYASPERKDGRPVGETEDFYSVGKILEFIRSHTEKFPRDKRYRRLIASLVQGDPEKRKDSLEAFLDGAGPKIRIAAIAVAGFVVLVLLIASLAVLLNNREENASPESQSQSQESEMPEIAGEEKTLSVSPSAEVVSEEVDDHFEESGGGELPAVGDPVVLPVGEPAASALQQPMPTETKMADESRLEEMAAKRIKAIYAQVERIVDDYNASENKGDPQYKREVDEAVKALLSDAMDISVYKKEFPGISEDWIADMVTYIMNQEEKPMVLKLILFEQNLGAPPK